MPACIFKPGITYLGSAFITLKSTAGTLEYLSHRQHFSLADDLPLLIFGQLSLVINGDDIGH